jgi:hypothetical protein
MPDIVPERGRSHRPFPSFHALAVKLDRLFKRSRRFLGEQDA